MDYLTVLASRSLVFFPPHDDDHHHARPQLPLSPNPNDTASPDSTPESRHQLLAPEPVFIPLQSLAWADRECALFLLNHLLSAALPSYEPNPAFSASPGTVSAMEKKLVAESEGLVWKEVEKGKQFVRAIGEWFGRTNVGGMSDETLSALALACGVHLKDSDTDDAGGGGGHKDGKNRHDGAVHHVQEVVFA